MPLLKPETRKWLAIGLAFVVAWTAFILLKSPFDLGKPVVPKLEGSGLVEPADFEWTLLDLDDRPVEFSKFKGRTIVLNLWATWCPPCLEEMPSLAGLAANDNLKGKDVAFVCASTDTSAASLRQFLAGKSWGMTVLRATSIPRVYLTEGIPATFVISPDGRVVASILGSANWDDPSVVDFLLKWAKPKPRAAHLP